MDQTLTLIGKIKLLHACHVHLELTLVAEQVLAVAGRVRVGSATRGRLGSVVLIRRRCPFLARLSN